MRRRTAALLAAALLAAAALAPAPATAAVLAVDLGAENLKLAIVKPGRIPISIGAPSQASGGVGGATSTAAVIRLLPAVGPAACCRSTPVPTPCCCMSPARRPQSSTR